MKLPPFSSKGPAKRWEAVEYARIFWVETVYRNVGPVWCSGNLASTQGRKKHVPSDEPRLVRRMSYHAFAYGRYGYRKVTAFLREEGWRVNHKRIKRLWRQEGLQVPKMQPKRKRLGLNDGSCVRLGPAYKDHVWSCDFVTDRTSDGRSFRMLTLIDEYPPRMLGD